VVKRYRWSILLLLTFALPASIAPRDLLATEAGPPVYLFWSASSSYSINARAFLHRLEVTEPDLRLHEFEVDASLPNAALLGQVYARVGLAGVTAVPLIVIGHHLIVGYIDDEHTGRHIVETIAECRKVTCRDPLRAIIDGAGTFDGVSLHGMPRP
jgi:hypothetical protein